MNFKQIGEDGFAYIHVGSWDQGGLRINDEEIWSNDSDIIQSVCSEPCQKAQIKVGNRPPLHRGWKTTPNVAHCKQVNVTILQKVGQTLSEGCCCLSERHQRRVDQKIRRKIRNGLTFLKSEDFTDIPETHFF